jgi:hypothetical protein
VATDALLVGQLAMVVVAWLSCAQPMAAQHAGPVPLGLTGAVCPDVPHRANGER